MAPAAVTDPNWMLSTLAQSSAAIVAIAAGLLASKLVTHRGEKEQAETEERAILARQEIAELAYGEAVAAREARSRHRCRVEVLESERKNGACPNLAEVMSYYETADCNEGDVRRWLTEVALEVVAARKALEATPPLDTSTMNENVVEAVRKRLERRRDAEARQGRFGLGLVGYIDIAEIIPAGDAVRLEARRNEFRELVASEKRSQQELALVLREWEIAYDRVQALVEPEGVRQLFLILGYIATVGLVIPLAIMASNPASVPSEIRALLVLFFSVGVASLFLYFWRLARLATIADKDTAKKG